MIILAFASLFPVAAQTSITTSNDTVICLGGTATLSATLISGSFGTGSYSFQTTSYDPMPFSGGISIDSLFAASGFAHCDRSTCDNCWGGPFAIGFNFCFFNKTYSQFWAGSNGWISFSDPLDSWTLFTPLSLPCNSPACPKNCIMAPYQDWYPHYNAGGPYNIYYYISGSAPNRKCVIYWNSCPMSGCTTGLPPLPQGTFQIVLNEQGNIIDNNIADKPACNSWQNNAATQGIQDSAGTVAFIVPGRNQSGWTASNESSRFVPGGITWYTGGYPGGTIVGYGSPITFSPLSTTVYTAVVRQCDGTTATDDDTVTVINPTFNYPSFSFCQSDPYPTPAVVTPGGIFTASPPGLEFVNINTGTINTGASIPGTYIITYSIGLCSYTGGRSISINPSPGVPDPLDSYIPLCGPGSVTFGVAQVPGVVINWYDAPVGGNLIFTGNSVTTNVNVTTHFYAEAFMPVSTCKSLTRADILVNVKPVPVVTTTPLSYQICSGDSIKITLLSSIVNSVFNWRAYSNSSALTGYSDGSGPVIAQKLSNSGSAVGIVIYAVVAVADTCISDSVHFTVAVRPFVDATASPATQQICSGQQCNIDLNSNITGTTFSWTAHTSSPDISGYSAGSGNHIQQTLQNTSMISGMVTYVIASSANGCTGDADSALVTVNPGPAVSLNFCNDTITTSNAQPIKLKGGIPLGGTYSGPGVLNGIFNPALAGVGTHQINYTYNNAALCSGTSHSVIHVLAGSNLPCGSLLTDVRDNKNYQTVQIGSQCWMSVNLDYGTMIPFSNTQRDNCIPEKYCYNDLVANCGMQTYYQWDEIMQYDITSGIQGLCPPGWHIPADAEWDILFADYTNNGFAGDPLKFGGISGFNAMLAGVNFMESTWRFITFATMIWSSTAHGPTKAWAHGMNDPNHSVSLYPALRSNGFTVRCLKD
jgi:uncharacterized protein (TIGR02145 family)